MAQFATRLKGIAQDINDTLDVDGLCWALLKRLQELVDILDQNLHQPLFSLTHKFGLRRVNSPGLLQLDL